MKTTLLTAMTLTLCIANASAQGKVHTTDSLTGLPLIPATDSGTHFNDPVRMPDGSVCKSKMQGVFYSLYKIKIDAAVAWYTSHLSGFKMVRGYESGRTQIAFSNSDGTVVLFITGDKAAEGQNADAYSVAYERYQPGLSEKTIASVTHGKILCN